MKILKNFFSKTKNFDTISDDDEVKIVSENQKLPIKNSLLQYNNSKKTDLMEADLDYNFPIPSSSANGTTQLKTSSSREGKHSLFTFKILFILFKD